MKSNNLIAIVLSDDEFNLINLSIDDRLIFLKYQKEIQLEDTTKLYIDKCIEQCISLKRRIASYKTK